MFLPTPPRAPLFLPPTTPSPAEGESVKDYLGETYLWATFSVCTATATAWLGDDARVGSSSAD